MVISHKTMHALTNHTQSFLDHLLKGTTDRHDFANRLHRRADQTGYTGKLREIPTWNLTDHIIKLWSNVCRRCCAHLTNLVERVAQGNLRSNKCQRITCSLRSQSRRTTQSGVDLDDTVVVCLGIESELDVTLTNNTKMLDALDGDFLQHLHLLVGK